MHLPKQLAAKLAAALILVTTMTVPSFAASIGTVTSDTGLNVRTEASTDAAVLTVLDCGTQVDVLSTSADGTWHQVTYNGVTGYVSGDYLQVTQEKLYGQVVSGPLNIRSGPGTEYASVGSLSQGAIVEIEELVGGYGGWYKIAQGYVSSDYVAQVDASVAASAGKGSQIVQYALELVGCPYVYGGSSPSGFDCSGFTTYVMKHFGYTINRTASTQMDNGTSVSRSELQPGDLVFFKYNTSKPVSHVGIYIGNGEFIHASTNRYMVQIDQMNTGHYANVYVYARRIL